MTSNHGIFIKVVTKHQDFVSHLQKDGSGEIGLLVVDIFQLLVYSWKSLLENSFFSFYFVYDKRSISIAFYFRILQRNV